MYTAQIATQFLCGQLNFSFAPNPRPMGDGLHEKSAQLPAGNQSTAFVNATGVATLSAGHTIVNATTVDVYWTIGGVLYSRLNCAAAVAGDAVTLTSGSGTALPADGTTLIVSNQVVLLNSLATSTIQALGINCDQPATVQFQAAGNSDLLTVGTIPYVWPTDNTEPNPFSAGTLVEIVASNQTTTATLVGLQITVLTAT
jgi:hypothetical protein